MKISLHPFETDLHSTLHNCMGHGEYVCILRCKGQVVGFVTFNGHDGLLFLPPYSGPGLNPLEEMLSYMKFNLKYHDDILQVLQFLCS